MNYVNNWQRAIVLAAGATSLALDLPDGEYRLTLTDSATEPTRWEIVGAVVAGGAGTLTRHLEGTTDQTWPSGSVIYCSLTAGALAGLRGVVTATVNGSGHLIITYSDGASVDAGYVVGAPGAPGTPGTPGTPGADGRGISSVAINGYGHLVITYTSGSPADVGLVVGTNGTNGRGISSTAIDGSGHLIVTYTDSTSADLGKVTGADGTGTGDVVGPSSSADGEVALFNGNTGKQLKRGDFAALVRAVAAAGISFATATAVVAADTILEALGKLQAQITRYRPQAFGAACSDLTTSITTGAFKGYLDIPYAFTVTEVYCTLATAQASGNIFTVNVKADGVTILSTKITIDNTETSSKTAATPPVISISALAAGARVSFDVDQVGASSVAKGLICYVVGYPA